jgi:hypothetical protein
VLESATKFKAPSGATSALVDMFGKQHTHVLQNIHNLLKSLQIKKIDAVSCIKHHANCLTPDDAAIIRS